MCACSGDCCDWSLAPGYMLGGHAFYLLCGWWYPPRGMILQAWHACHTLPYYILQTHPLFSHFHSQDLWFAWHRIWLKCRVRRRFWSEGSCPDRDQCPCKAPWGGRKEDAGRRFSILKWHKQSQISSWPGESGIPRLTIAVLCPSYAPSAHVDFQLSSQFKKWHKLSLKSGPVFLFSSFLLNLEIHTLFMIHSNT